VFLSDVSIRRPVFATMMVGSLLLFGLISRQRMGVALYPEVDFPNVSITTTLQGASPEVTETELTDPIEDAISSVEGIKHISSANMQGFSQVKVEFDLERDIDTAAQDIRDKISLANRYLPKDSDPPVISKVNMASHPIIWIAVNGDVPRKLLGQTADEIFKPYLETLRGVGSIVIGGLQEREMRIWLNAQKMEAYHITSSDVEAALQNKNIQVPGGSLESTTRELSVKTMGELENADAFNRLIIAYREGSPIRLQDIGFAEDGVADRRSVGRFQGVTAIGMGVVPRSGANHVEVCNLVKKTMEQLRKIAPPGINLAIAFDSSEFIKNSISDVQSDLLFGSFLAALVVFLFLRNLASTIIIALAIPTSLIGSFSIMYALGFTMNSMTMLALSLCCGLVVDDAIVVLENVFRHGEMGKDRLRAAFDGTNEIVFAVIAATLSIVAVFIPVAFIRGIIGRFYFQFGVSVSVAILISLFVAFTLTPMLCSRFLNTTKKHGPIYNFLEDAFSRIDSMYRVLLAWCLGHRLTVVTVATVVFVLSLGFFKILGKELIQKEDRDDFVVRVETPVGTSLTLGDKKLAQCEAILRALPEVKSIFALMGAGGFTSVTNKGFMFVQLTDSTKRKRKQAEIMSFLRKELNRISGVVAYVEDITAMGSGGMGRNAPLQFRIKGPDLTQLGDISTKIVARLRTITGIVGVGSDMELTKPEVRVYIDRDKAGDLGVDVKTIASAISTLIGGKEVSEFRVGGNSYDVRVRLIPEQRSMFQDVNSLLVRNTAGELIRLSNVVDVREEIGPDVINRLDRQRSINIFADLEGKTLGEVVEQTRKIVEETLPPGYSIEFGGQAETMAETFQSIIFAFLLTIVITYMVLASQFESFIHPFTIMLALPLTVIGALGFLFITRNSINLMSLIGMLMLIGLVVKNSILLVDYTNTLRTQGMEMKAAILEAGPVRLRPILMTAISTIVGVLPVALGLGAGSESRAPMAIAVAGGMTSSTILTLLVVPVAYSMIDDLSRRFGFGKKEQDIPQAN
jgi:HAE1 family hydrophobic/amphiphilic exporter-1